MQKNWIVPAVILLVAIPGCNRARRRAQQELMVKDILAMNEAAAAGHAPPPLPEDPEAYGRTQPFMTFLRGQYQRLYEINQELGGLIKGSEFWTRPQEWTSPDVVKDRMAKADRTLALIDDLTRLVEDTVGVAGRKRIADLDLPSDFKMGVIEGMEGRSKTFRLGQDVMGACRQLVSARQAILALADGTQVKVSDGVPLFPTGEDADRYRSLVRKEQEATARIRILAPQLQAETQAAAASSRASAKALLQTP